MTNIYFLDVSLGGYSEAEKWNILNKTFQRLTPERRKKVNAIRFLEDKLCSAGAGVLLDLGLKKYGLTAAEEEIAYKETAGNGSAYKGSKKPYLKHHPEICFNLSHSGSMVMAAFSAHEVGCDIEKIGKENLKLAKRFFHPEEWKVLEGTDDKKELFYRYWTLKESLMKVTGEGMGLPLNGFCIRLEKEPITVEMNGELKPYVLHEYALPGYRAALCVEETAGDVFSAFQNLQDVV